MTELKPCPFCGATPVTDEAESDGHNYVRCPTCFAEMHCCGNLAHAIAHWNRRAPAQSGENDRAAEARDAARYRHIESMFRVFSLGIGGQHSYCATGALGRMRGPSFGVAIDADIAAKTPAAGEEHHG